VAANDPFDDGKSYSCTLELRIGMEPSKGEKHFVRVCRIETGPVVLDIVAGFPVFFNGPELGEKVSVWKVIFRESEGLFAHLQIERVNVERIGQEHSYRKTSLQRPAALFPEAGFHIFRDMRSLGVEG